MPVRRHPVAVSEGNEPLDVLPLDLALIARLKETYARVRAHELHLASLFYTRLFAAHPHLRSMFQGDLAAQAHKLTAALDAVVRNLERPGDNAAMVGDLGRRHAGYGAKPEHYAVVTDLLVESMREVLGPSAEPRALDEWATALRLISKRMIAAAEGQPADRQDREQPTRRP